MTDAATVIPETDERQDGGEGGRAQGRGRRPLRSAVAAVLVLLAGALAAVIVVTSESSPAHARTVAISFDEHTCAPGWRAPKPGLYDFEIENRSRHVATVSLFQSLSGVVVTQLASLRPGSAGSLSYRFSQGSAYTWACQLAGLPREVSVAAQVPGPQAHFVPYTAPVTVSELVPPLQAFRRYVDSLLTLERRQVGALVRATRAGDAAGARTAWLTAHLTWLKIGEDDGAYGAFGQLGRSIDGTAAGLVGGTASPKFTGFHKVELDLWTRHDLGAAARDSARLAAMIGSLTPRTVAEDLPTGKASIGEWTLRCHEILEDALRDSLSANDDYGANTDLASLTADIAATRELLGLLTPLISERAPTLVQTAQSKLTRLQRTLAAAGGGHRRVGIVALGLFARERIDAATDAALETLAPVSELMQIGNT